MVPKPVQKAVIYCRVSTQKQVEEGHGLNSQETRCREYARHKGYDVIRPFHDEGESGSLMDRPDMKAMLSFLRSNRKEQYVVIIDDISRLARNIETHIHLRSEIAAVNARLESPSIEFGEDSDSRLVEHLLACVAAHQREKGAEQVTNRMRARALNGYWVAPPPVGYCFKKIEGHGKMLVRKEPEASIVQEALESFASGRFETQAEVKVFLERQTKFPKGRSGKVHYQRIRDMLAHPLYAGRLTHPQWNIYNHPGKHKGLISYTTHQAIQKRLKTQARAPFRKDIRHDFPLRGFVTCGDCGHALTSVRARGRSKHYSYYHCYQKSCEQYGISIKKEQVEEDFETLLRSLKPSKELFNLALAAFRLYWNRQTDHHAQEQIALQGDLKQLERKTENLLDKIVDTDHPQIASTLEKRLRHMEEQKIVLEEKIAQCGTEIRDFDKSFRTAFEFFENPHKLWASDDITHKRMALKLVFTERMAYDRNEGFRTAPIALPYRVLRDFREGQSVMVGVRGFEPPTTATPLRCATRLRHTPNDLIDNLCLGSLSLA